MDIYKWAEDFFYCSDYYDHHTGLVYKCQEYGKEMKTNPNARIKAYDIITGKYVLTVKKKGDK